MEFLAIYVREAHPIDGWRMESNDQAGIAVAQPKDKTERTAVAEKCCSLLEMNMPLLVDELDDRVGNAYSGMPDRLYVIDREGKVAFKSGRGPFGFRPGEMEQALLMTLLDESRPPEAPKAGASRLEPPARVPLMDNAAAWRRLPIGREGQPPIPTLPNWARALSSSLPRTTAAMLDLDYKHRARSPLDPVLRGKMRWVAADANGCAYSRAYAESDLRRAGLDESALALLRSGDLWKQPADERAALEFARKMTLSADTVTDEEVARLRAAHGDAKVVAMVLLLAYSNFQDRLLLTLGVPVEAGGPLAPLEVRIDKEAAPPEVPPRGSPEGRSGPSAPERVDDAEWVRLNFDDLQKQLDRQRSGPGRIRVPSWDEVKAALPAGYPVPPNPVRIRWSLVCVGYQPELAIAWSACTRAFGEEAKQDRVFEESVFWVTTRTIDCFY